MDRWFNANDLCSVSRGGDVSFVVDELKAVFDPRGGAWVGGKYIPSILAAIGGILEEHMMKIGFIKDSDTSLFIKVVK